MDGMRNFKQFTPLIVALFSRVAFESFAIHDAMNISVADKSPLSGLQRPQHIKHGPTEKNDNLDLRRTLFAISSIPKHENGVGLLGLCLPGKH